MAEYFVVQNEIARRAQRRERIFRDRSNPLEMYDDIELLQKFRFPAESIRKLVDICSPFLTRPTNRNNPLPPLLQVTVALRFYGKGLFQFDNGDTCGVTQSSISKSISAVTDILCQMRSDFIKFPTTIMEKNIIKEKCYQIKGFPNVIGLIDGTHIYLAPPSSDDEKLYVCRKGGHSINVQIVSDAEMMILDVVSRYPGSTNDAYIWNQCALRERFMSNDPHGYLLDTFSVSHAIDALGFGKFQIMLSLLTGLCWMADSMEMMILSILAPALHCKLCINKYQQAFLTNAVFFGMMISSPFWGNLSDRYGRRKALWASVGVLFFYGAISAFSTGYYWLLFFRFFVGFAIGCVPQSVTLYAEFLPSKQRARCVVLLDCFWALGACLEVLIALVVMPTLGWKWLLGISSIPVLFFFILCYWLPESVRYLAVSGQTDKAMATLERIAEDNKKHMLLGRLIVDDMQQSERGRFKDLIRPDMRRTTLLLWFIWMSCAFCYYGVVFLTTEIFEQNDLKIKMANMSGLNSSIISRYVANETNAIDSGLKIGDSEVCDPNNPTCIMLTTSDYVGLLWITLAEFPGILITIFALDKIGRKKTIGFQFILFAVTIFAFTFNIENRLITTVILFLARGIVSGIFQAAYVYTPEVYPTSMRAIGIGTCSSMARIGAMLTPYVAQVLSQSSRPLAASCYGVAALIAAVLSLLLPFETKGKSLPD